MTDSPAGGGASRYVDTEGVYDRVAERLGRAGEWALSPHDAGLGNETLFLVWGSRQFVLRRPPLDERTRDLHDVLREFRVLEELDGTDLPTPRPLLACRDESIARTPFTVQQRLDGHVLRHGEPAAYATANHRRRVGEQLVDALAAVHAVDPRAVRLDGFGPATLAEHVERWRERFRRYHGETDRTVPGVEAIGTWLAANAPASAERTLVHGEFTLANATFTEDAPPELVGVLDWERAGGGDPLLDLGRTLACWFESGDERAGLPPQIAPGFTTRKGYHDRAALVERYERTTGRRFEHDRFYRAMPVFELATVCESYYLRHLRGVSDRAVFPDLEDAVPALVERALAIADGEEPL